ncbi:hypothetical protein EW146_g377 [Bondarzewia mesenterica]|uniref:Rab-GAP TBC domain-containing protein n=1 Tax=Bondarzewia mesenterica TaxID=1095465 RepID=A0A4S4M751_9AGAM|nr:hypothetical protein EW146_g377 [Bondarzewia mesenterica]
MLTLFTGCCSQRHAYDHLFKLGLSLSKIKDAALGGRLFDSSEGAPGAPGRSLAWKVFLIPPGPLERPPDLPLTHTTYLDSLRVSRTKFTQLLLVNMRAPDGSYEDGFVTPGTDSPPRRPDGTSGNLERNNPLSLHDENPWKEWFAAVELRKTISQDVERTFPDIGYFRSPAVQSQLTNVLFLYSVMHPWVGYRQGMHELLAPLYYAVDYDSILEGDDTSSSTNENNELAEMCSRRWVAADSWALFSTVMHGVSRWYEWQESPHDVPSAVPGHVQLSVPNGQVRIEPYVAPILQACNRIQKEYLKSVDPALWERMQSAGIEPQIYGIRWLRLLFTREFNMHDAMILWDGLFAVDPTFELAPWICVAMLVRIRNRLIPSDYSTQLTYLLRYPTPPTLPSSALHHATLLLRQALTLQMSPSPATGAAIVFENRNLLGIPTEVPEPPEPQVRRGGRPGESQRRRQSVSESTAGPSKNGHAKQMPSASQFANLGLFKQGLLDRGEALGLNQTFFNAVSEIKKNLPDLAANLVRSPPSQSASYAAYPLVDERPPEERPPWEPRTRFEMEKGISDMKALQKHLGESVGWIVDTLLLDEGEKASEDQIKNIQARKREALESLAYVRDILLGSVVDVEEDRLVSEELKKRKEKAKLEQEERQAAKFGTDTSSSRALHDQVVIAPPIPSHKQPAAPPTSFCK